jgi:hypothetical protein
MHLQQRYISQSPDLMFVDPCINIRVQFTKKYLTTCNSVSKFYFIFIWSSTCFGQHTAHHQESKTALAASGFSYVEGCWTCSWTRGCQRSFRLLMIGCVSPETCWASYKYGIIKYWYIVAPCWIFLYELWTNTRVRLL